MVEEQGITCKDAAADRAGWGDRQDLPGTVGRPAALSAVTLCDQPVGALSSEPLGSLTNQLPSIRSGLVA